jgi:hypothetical protein
VAGVIEEKGAVLKERKIQQFELGPFWEGHREMLGKLVETEMPSTSRSHYTEVMYEGKTYY